VHDSANVMFACRVWGLRSTDIMQGVVYGTRVDAMDLGDPRCRTRLDFDQCFGTALNRYCAQAVIGEPLSVYGSGGQKRGFLPLRDSIQCLTLAIENPPAEHEYRVFNQFEDVYDVHGLALKVQKVAHTLGLEVAITRFENPRGEREEHYYNPDHQNLLALGYQPTHDMESELALLLEDLLEHRERIAQYRAALGTDIRWSGARKKIDVVATEGAADANAGDAATPRSMHAARGASR